MDRRFKALEQLIMDTHPHYNGATPGEENDGNDTG